MIHEVEGRNPGCWVLSKSQCDMHVIVVAEGLVAVGTLSGPRCEALLHAFFAEHVTTGLDGRVLEVAATHSAECQSL